MASSIFYYCDRCGRTYPNQYAVFIYKTAFKTIERENFRIGNCKDCNVNDGILEKSNTHVNRSYIALSQFR